MCSDLRTIVQCAVVLTVDDVCSASLFCSSILLLIFLHEIADILITRIQDSGIIGGELVGTVGNLLCDQETALGCQFIMLGEEILSGCGTDDIDALSRLGIRSIFGFQCRFEIDIDHGAVRFGTQGFQNSTGSVNVFTGDRHSIVSCGVVDKVCVFRLSVIQ